jgi:hypothetical protein
MVVKEIDLTFCKNANFIVRKVFSLLLLFVTTFIIFAIKVYLSILGFCFCLSLGPESFDEVEDKLRLICLY